MHFGRERSTAFDTDALCDHPAHRVPGALARRRRGHVRRADVPEGLGRRPHARAVPRRGRLPRRHPPLPPDPPVRQHRDQRPVGCARGRDRRAGAGDDGQLDLPGRLPAAAGRRRGRRPDHDPRNSSPVHLPAPDDDRRRPARGTCPSSCAAAHGATPPGAARRRRRPRSPSAAARSWPTPAATASTGSPTASRSTRPARRLGRRSNRSSATRCSTTPWRCACGQTAGGRGRPTVLARLVGHRRDRPVDLAAGSGGHRRWGGPSTERRRPPGRRGCATTLAPTLGTLGTGVRGRRRRPPAGAARPRARAHGNSRRPRRVGVWRPLAVRRPSPTRTRSTPAWPRAR